MASLQLLVGLPALWPGLALIHDPSGAALGLRTEWLSASPFDDYLIPGLFLFMVIGLGHLGGAYLSARARPWGRPWGMGLGLTLLFWILFQWIWLEPRSALQDLMLGLGLLEAWLAWSSG